MTAWGWKPPSNIPGQAISAVAFFSAQGSVGIPVDIPRPWTSLWTPSRVVGNSKPRRSSTIASISRLLFQVRWARNGLSAVATGPGHHWFWSSSTVLPAVPNPPDPEGPSSRRWSWRFTTWVSDRNASVWRRCWPYSFPCQTTTAPPIPRCTTCVFSATGCSR